jgi:uncharacterized protein
MMEMMTANNIENSTLFDDVFCIPHNGEYIVYLPLRRIILLGNAKFVNLLYRSRLGNRKALSQLSINKELVDELFESEQQLRHVTRPRKMPPFKPTNISLFLTNDCTLRCKYCYADGGSNQKQMSWDMITGLIHQLVENVRSVKSKQMAVNFHGGGDLSAVWPLFLQTREYLEEIAAANGIQVRTSAGLNGFLNPGQQKWIIENINSATVSLDGPPEIHDFQRPCADGSPSFPYVSQTLKAFDKANFPYGIRTTVTAESVARMEEIVSFFCEAFTVKTIKIEPMFRRGRAVNSEVHSPDASEFVKYFRKAVKIANAHGRELSYSGSRLETITCIFCQAAGDSCAVTPEGWITSCYEVLSPSDPLSELFFYGYFDVKEKKLVVDDKKRKKLFDLTVLSKPFCSKCFCKWNCAGDCPVKSIHKESTSDPDVVDRCYINRELLKDQLIEELDKCGRQSV